MRNICAVPTKIINLKLKTIMTNKQKDFVFRVIAVCFDWIDMDDVEEIYNAIEQDVIADIEESADPVYWHDGDVRIAIVRVLKKRLGIES